MCHNLGSDAAHLSIPCPGGRVRGSLSLRGRAGIGAGLGSGPGWGGAGLGSGPGWERGWAGIGAGPLRSAPGPARPALAAAFIALRVLLGIFFFLTGALKVSDWLSADLHRHMASEFVRFAKVFPLKDLGFVPEPGRYLAAVGWVEVTAGLLLAFGPQLLQEISNFILSVVMIGAIYTLLALQEPLAMCAPATLSLGLLLLLNIRGYPAAPRPKFE